MTMDYPDGFKELVNAVKKEPVPVASGREIWEKFCRVVFIGKDRSDAEISFLMAMLKKYIDYDYVMATDGEDWESAVRAFLKERLGKIRDDSAEAAVSGVLRDLFYITASIKGGARFFRKKGIFENLATLASGKEKTKELIDEIAEDGDVAGIKYTKAILWLQYCGFAKDFAPPAKHLKTFVNSDVGPYYRYYEDDEYFMKKAEEMASDFPDTSLADVYRAVYLYRTFKSAMPRGSKFTPRKLLEFMKKKKVSVSKMFSMLSDSEGREELAKKMAVFMGY
ncbi:MAG: hypothetical protein J4431_02055 [Candidatus Aenigmarchaeota archaeon]|nr:hypothetical protein [Candidatus Aenigmarchaeota archaeon]